MHGPLSGIRVLDFSTLLPGPLATLFMAEAGAEVIKIERPDKGDEMRGYVPRWGGESTNFHLLNQGKKSVVLDLKSPDQRERMCTLIETTDIVVEQFRPRVMARLGLDYDDMAAIKPDIIYCSITGYGQFGPKSLRAGHDLNYQGDTGLLAVSHGTADVPVVPPMLAADIAGGTYPALVNILLALRHRDRTGQGAYLDIAMAENLFPLLYWAQGEGQATGRWPGNGDALTTGGTPRYRLYPTADGRMAAIAAIEQKFWETFCEAIGLEIELRQDERDPEATIARVAGIIRTRSSTEWAAVFDEADCCCSIMRGLDEAQEDPHFVARGVFGREIEGRGGERMAALPTPICLVFRAGVDEATPAPALGANTIKELLSGSRNRATTGN